MSFLVRCYCYRIIFLSFIVLSQVHPANAEKIARTKITWLIEDTYAWESYLEDISTSTEQDTSKMVMKALEDLGYDLTFVRATGDRAHKILQEDPYACMSNRIKNPDREKYLLFSLPHDLYLGLKIYRVYQDKPLAAQVLNDKGEVTSLATLFSQYPNKILATGSGVSYGEAIDSQVAELHPENVFIRAGASRVLSIINMLFKGRIDFIIYYPQDINEINKDGPKLEGYTIAGSPPYLLGHVSCAKSPQGAKIIADIDQFLKKAYRTHAFYHAHEKWLIEGDLPTLRQYFYQIFGYLPDKKQENN